MLGSSRDALGNTPLYINFSATTNMVRSSQDARDVNGRSYFLGPREEGSQFTSKFYEAREPLRLKHHRPRPMSELYLCHPVTPRVDYSKVVTRPLQQLARRLG